MDTTVSSSSAPEARWIAQLEDPKVSKRDEALAALGELRNPATNGPILKLLGKEQNANTRRNAINALGKIGDPSATQPLLDILTVEQNAFVRKEAVQVLGKLGQPEATAAIGRILLDDPDYGVRHIAVVALCNLGSPPAMEALRRGLLGKLPASLRGQIVTNLGDMKADAAALDVEKVLLSDGEESVRRAAAKALVKIRGATAIPTMKKALENETTLKVKVRILEVLGELGDSLAIPLLYSTLFAEQNPEIRRAVTQSVKKTPGWESKVSCFLHLLDNSKMERTQLPIAEIIESIAPPADELARMPYLLTDLLIKNATDKDKRMTEILAALIIASTGNDLQIAGDRINAMQQGGVPGKSLESLRIQVGGETALDPWMQMLTHDLRVYFREPIKDLNVTTLASWQNTVRYAQYGFNARMIMSVVVFIVGILLMIVSSYRFMFATLDTRQMFGNGVPFLSGLATTLLIIYTGPMKEVRNAVDDLGIASAAFIAYVYRVLQISHTYSFYYLERKITFEEMQKSSKLIEDAVNDTIAKLSTPHPSSSEETLRSVLNKIVKQIKENDVQLPGNGAGK